MAEPRSQLMKEIGLRIKLRRITQGIKQRHLAETLGMQQPFLSAIEAGRKPLGVEQLCKIAQALDCPASYLLGEEQKAA